MCTAIAKTNGKNKDIIYGYNLDIDPDVWNYSLIKNGKWFSVAIKVGSTTYLTHGVNRSGRFSNIPYMNGGNFAVEKGMKRERIDLMCDRYIRGKYSFEDIIRITQTKALVSPPAASMHSLIGDENGRIIIAEPGYGTETVSVGSAVITNFPVLADLSDYSDPFYGKDRYDAAVSFMGERGDDFSVTDALKLLETVKQDGQWGTKISFVYSRNDNSVYYFLNGDISTLAVHRFDSQ